jgi:hypothetical protein
MINGLQQRRVTRTDILQVTVFWHNLQAAVPDHVSLPFQCLMFFESAV